VHNYKRGRHNYHSSTSKNTNINKVVTDNGVKVIVVEAKGVGKHSDHPPHTRYLLVHDLLDAQGVAKVLPLSWANNQCQVLLLSRELAYSHHSP
jgi:hypothetical protein